MFSFDRIQRELDKVIKRRKLKEEHDARCTDVMENVAQNNKYDRSNSFDATVKVSCLKSVLKSENDRFESLPDVMDWLLERHQVLYPAKVSEPDFGDKAIFFNLLAQMETPDMKQIMDISNRELIQELVRQTILNECLDISHVLRKCSDGLCGSNISKLVHDLFKMVSLSSDEMLSSAALRHLNRMYGTTPNEKGHLTQWVLHLPNQQKTWERFGGKKVTRSDYHDTCTLPCIDPETIFQSFRANGYRIREKDVKGRVDPKLTWNYSNKDSTHSNESFLEDCSEASLNGEMKIHNLSNILKLIAVLCQYHNKIIASGQEKGDQGTTWGIWTHDSGGICELIEAVLRMILDPCYDRIDKDIRRALHGLVSIFKNQIWEKHVLPSMARFIANLGCSVAPCLLIMREILPRNCRNEQTKRMYELHQFAGCYALIRMSTSKKNKSTFSREELHPSLVIKRQPWFAEPKYLLDNEISSEVLCVSKDFPLVLHAEMILQICHRMLWPLALAIPQSSKNENCSKKVDINLDRKMEIRSSETWMKATFESTFKDSWYAFLRLLCRNIKVGHTELRGIKLLANRYECLYKEILGD